MSKHQKEVRRTRRKAEQRRRSSAATHGAAALAAAAAIAAGTSAYAEPIRFDNPAGPGHFDWSGGEGADFVYLDLVLPASGQTGSGGVPTTLAQRWVGDHSVVTGAVRTESGGYLDYYAIPHNAGDLIPSGAPFRGTADIVYAGSSSELPEGVATYLGVRFDQGSGWQYGWVGVVRTGYELDAFAWGYETEPGVPIAAGVPEPDSLALLAMGAVGVLSRRRR